MLGELSAKREHKILTSIFDVAEMDITYESGERNIRIRNPNVTVEAIKKRVGTYVTSITQPLHDLEIAGFVEKITGDSFWDTRYHYTEKGIKYMQNNPVGNAFSDDPYGSNLRDTFGKTAACREGVVLHAIYNKPSFSHYGSIQQNALSHINFLTQALNDLECYGFIVATENPDDTYTAFKGEIFGITIRGQDYYNRKIIGKNDAQKKSE